jgi:hypothetical protein
VPDNLSNGEKIMKTIPDENKIENLFANVRLTPGERFYGRMRRAAWTPTGIARRRTYVVTGLTIVLLAALLAFTPQGRAWAQEITHFFTRATSDTLPVTPLPLTVTQDPGYVFNKAIADAGHQAGFDALEPAWLPVDPSGRQILSFDGASFEPDHQIVRIFYRYALGGDDLTDGLVLREERFRTVDDCELCGMVGASALIEQVQIGAFSGEYVAGVWKADDSGNWKWESDPYIQTLRWQKGDLALEIQYFGQEVEKADLIAVAESIK